MKKERNVQNIVIMALAAVIVVMSVGYALYNQTLNINGKATFNKAVWDVHFDTDTFSETSTIKSTTNSVQNTTISYEVTLEKPGDTYSFTVNAKNFGTIDAKATKLTLTGLDAAQQKYITYKVSYNGTEYTSTSDLDVALASGASHPVVVTVSYILPENANDLPTSDNVTVDLDVSIDYVDTVSTTASGS